MAPFLYLGFNSLEAAETHVPMNQFTFDHDFIHTLLSSPLIFHIYQLHLMLNAELILEM